MKLSTNVHVSSPFGKLIVQHLSSPCWKGVYVEYSCGIPKGRPLWNTYNSAVRSIFEGQLWKRAIQVIQLRAHSRRLAHQNGNVENKLNELNSNVPLDSNKVR